MRHQLDRLLVGRGASIRDAMGAIDRGGAELALAVDDAGRLTGTVTDGDLRRALLAGRTLDDPVESHVTLAPKVVGPSTPRSEVLDLMRAWSLSQIPVVDDDGRLVGLHLLQALLGEERPNWAVVMAGGRGTRLAPFTDDVPKPMLRVAGRPILERIVLHLVGAGIRRIFLSVNYRREAIEDHFGDGSQFGCRIDYLREDPERPLGTAGSLRLLEERPSDPVLVMNGDLVTQFAVGDMLEVHAREGTAATMAVSDYVHSVPFGVCETDGSRLVRLREKPVSTWLVNAGIYVLDPSLLDHVPADREFHVPQLLLGCLERGEPVGTWRLAGEWLDVGRPAELRRAVGA